MGNLIFGIKVVRNEQGEWIHPDLPAFSVTDRHDNPFELWLKSQMLELHIDHLETSQAPEKHDFLSGRRSDIAFWEPTKPEGGHWFLLAIAMAGRTAHCMWVRRPIELDFAGLFDAQARTTPDTDI